MCPKSKTPGADLLIITGTIDRNRTAYWFHDMLARRLSQRFNSGSLLYITNELLARFQSSA
jgi:hypothetical protein